MPSAEVIQVIRTRLQRRGEGESDGDPIRIITQYWTLDGELLAEVDPMPPSIDHVIGGKVGLGFRTPASELAQY